jgi:hypothetical protein
VQDDTVAPNFIRLASLGLEIGISAISCVAFSY